MIIMEIVDIIAVKDVYQNWHPMIIKLIIEEMKSNPSPTRPKAKRKWQERVSLLRQGTHYLVNCCREGKKIVIKSLRRHKKKIKPLLLKKT